MTCDCFKLALVWRNDRRAAILFEVSSFRVDQHRHPGLAANGDHAADVGQRALAVVRQDHSASTFYRFPQHLDQGFTRHCRGILLVQPDQLLTPALHPGLCDGRPIRDTVKIALNIAAGHDHLERIAGFVRADNADQSCCYAKARQVDGHIGRATGPVFRLLDVYDWHRRLRRNSAGRTEQVAVEHHIAGDDDAGLRKIRNRYSHARTLA